MAKKILFVDDDFNILNLLYNFLTMKGFEVETVENGYFALKKIQGFKPDIILLDIMMPRLDGYEVCARIRDLPDPDLARTPIIVVSALNHLNDGKKAINAGANDYIVKPINLNILFDKINRYVKVDSLLKKETVDDNLLTVERLDKGLVISLQGKLDQATFRLFEKNLSNLPHTDFLILFFQNIQSNSGMDPILLDEFIKIFASLSIKKKAVAVEQRDVFLSLENPCLAQRLILYNTLMEAYEGIKNLK